MITVQNATAHLPFTFSTSILHMRKLRLGELSKRLSLGNVNEEVRDCVGLRGHRAEQAQGSLQAGELDGAAPDGRRVHGAIFPSPCPWAAAPSTGALEDPRTFQYTLFPEASVRGSLSFAWTPRLYPPFF